MGNRSVKLTVYDIVDRQTATDVKDLSVCVSDVLTRDKRKALDRFMPLCSDEETDCDVLSTFKILSGMVWGLVLRLVPSAESGSVPQHLLEKETFSLSDIDEVRKDSMVLKKSIFVAFDGNHLVTTATRQYDAVALATYFNWLVERQRGTTLFEFRPHFNMKDCVDVKNIKSIEIGAGTFKVPTECISRDGVSTKVEELSRDVLSSIFPALDVNMLRNIVSARLLLKFKKMPKNKEELGAALQARMTLNIDSADFEVQTKDGSTIKGQQMLEAKQLSVPTTSRNRYDENFLQQEMEAYLRSV